MRIDPNAVVSQATIETSKSQGQGQARTKVTTRPLATVVKLSSAGAALSEQEVSSATTERLDKIRAMLDAGEYPIDLDLLASRIVDDELLRSGGGGSKV